MHTYGMRMYTYGMSMHGSRPQRNLKPNPTQTRTTTPTTQTQARTPTNPTTQTQTRTPTHTPSRRHIDLDDGRLRRHGDGAQLSVFCRHRREDLATIRLH